MKKLLKILLAFALIFVLSFNSVKAQEDEESSEEIIVANVTVAPVVKVKGNNNSLILTWEAVENATGYKIERSTNSTKGFKKIAQVTTLTYTDKKLTYGTKYYYKVTAFNENSKKTSVVVNKKVVPNKIVNVIAKQSGSTKVKLTWDKSSNTGYYVFRSTDGKKFTKIKTISKNSTLSFTDSKLKSNKNYYYQVQAYQKVGKTIYTGSKSDIIKVKTAPAAPALKVYSDSIDTIRIRITKVTGATRYEYYSYNESTKKWELNWNIYPEWFVGDYDNEYDYAEKPYHTYKYRVRACRDTVCGSYKEISGQAKLAKVQIYGLRAEKKAVHVMIEYSWDAQGYEVYRATSKNGKYTKVKTLKGEDSTYFKDTKVSANKTYYYKIRSYTKIGKKTYYSAYSSIRIVKTGTNAGVNSAYEDAKLLNKEWFYSKKSLINILVDSYGYKKADATKGVEKCKIDYKKNALNLAKNILKYSYAISESGLRYSLVTECLFTASEADYALSKVNIDGIKSLKEAIQQDHEYGPGYGRGYYIDVYTDNYLGFTEEEVDAVIAELAINFNESALNNLNNYLSNHSYESDCVNRSDASEHLKDYGFNSENIDYAFENANDYNWTKCIVNDYNNVEFYEGVHNYYSKQRVIQELTGEYYLYTETEVNAMIEEQELNFSDIALGKANQLLAEQYLSEQALENLLVEALFTEDEIDYALANINIDFGFNAYMMALEVIDSDTNTKNRSSLSSYLDLLGFTQANIESAFGMISEDKWIGMAEYTITYYINWYNTDNNMGLTQSGLTSIMVNDFKFTTAEVNAALENLAIDFANQALISAKKYISENTYSKTSLIQLLVNSGYSEEDATTAANSNEINYGEECVEYINSHYIGVDNPGSLENIIDDLGAYGFSESEIQYAIEKTNLESYL